MRKQASSSEECCRAKNSSLSDFPRIQESDLETFPWIALLTPMTGATQKAVFVHVIVYNLVVLAIVKSCWLLG